MTAAEVAGRSTTSPVSGAMDAQLVEQLRQLGTWRDRALEAEARLAAVAGLVDAMRSELWGDDGVTRRLERIVDAPGPTIAAGQTWETREGNVSRQAVVLYAEVAPGRQHEAGARYWRIRSQRASTIREDVLRRRWQLVERAEATS